MYKGSTSLYYHKKTKYYFVSTLHRVGNSLIKFWSESLVFCQKSEQMSYSLKKWAISSFAHFWWATWAILSRSIIPSERLSKSLMVAHLSWAIWAICSLRSEGMSESFAFLKNFQKTVKTYKKYKFFNFFWANCLFFLSKRENLVIAQKTEWFAHSLFCPEQPERIAHIYSFFMNDLSDSLTVAHLSWVSLANWSHSLICPERFEQMKDEQMSKFPTLSLQHKSFHWEVLWWHVTSCFIKYNSIELKSTVKI